MLGETSLIPDAQAAVTSTARTSTVERPVPSLGGEGSKDGRVGGLVLTRHLGESIMIGEDVEVQVVGLKAGTVRLKFVAPRTVPVHRREVFDAIKSGVEPSTPTPQVAPVDSRPAKISGGLVLARLARQSVMIGEDVEIGVVEVRPSTVKLRIAAPRSVSVHRREVFDSLKG